MGKSIGAIIVIVIGVVCVYGFVLVSTYPPQIDERLMHYSSYAHKDFYKGIEQPDFLPRISEKIYGGIVSHHLLTSEEIGKFFAELRSKERKTIVLIGPNHFGIGEHEISMSAYPYQTPWGIVSPQTDIIRDLQNSGVATIDEAPFTYEHSISALVPFISFNLPEATLIPIVLKSSVTRSQLDALVEELESVLPENSVVIASVDFSHHQNRTAAGFHDTASISAIKTFDYDRIFNLEIDSPPSIYTLLKYLEKQDASNMTYSSFDATDFTGDVAMEDVTSYVFAHFTKGESMHETVPITLHFGDMMFGRGVEQFINDGGDPFGKIQGIEGNFLRGVDSIIGNLEGVITEDTECKNKEIVFTFSLSTSKLLAKHNIDGVSLANNHSGDCYKSGLANTKQNLDAHDLFYLDGNDSATKYHTIVVGEKRIAIVGMNEIGISQNDFSDSYTLISSLKNDHDAVVVHIHWGYEYSKQPSLIQKEIAHALIDSGADVIIGHHPHVVQPVEYYKKGLIFYSLGNFIFDQPAEETKIGFGVGLTHNKTYTGAYLFPYRIHNFQPTLLPYADAEIFCKAMLEDGGEAMPCYTKSRP